MLVGLCLKTFKKRTIIFCTTKKEAHSLRVIFGIFGLNSAELHGNLTQMERLKALNEFRKGNVNYLLCTDVAARGLDIVGVDTVINMDFPTNIKTYIHRVGRTARAGRIGHSITFVGESRRKLLKQLVTQATKRGESLKSRTLNPKFVQWLYKILEEMIPLLKEIAKEEILKENYD